MNLDDPFSDKGGDPTSWKHFANEARALFHNSRIIGLACERRDGDGQQLAGGGPRMCRCWWSSYHGNRLD